MNDKNFAKKSEFKNQSDNGWSAEFLDWKGPEIDLEFEFDRSNWERKPTTNLNLEKYHQMIDSGILNNRHVELLQGKIIEMSPESPFHADASDEADEYLKEMLGKRAKVRVGKPITLSDNNEPEPDLAIVKRQRYTNAHPSSEDIFWLIEYSNSSLEKDLKVKSKIYATAGIPEYWVVNLALKVLIVFRYPENGNYQTEVEYSDRLISPLAFQNLDLTCDRIIGNF